MGGFEGDVIVNYSGVFGGTAVGRRGKLSAPLYWKYKVPKAIARCNEDVGEWTKRE